MINAVDSETLTLTVPRLNSRFNRGAGFRIKLPVFPLEVLHDVDGRDAVWRRCRRLGLLLWSIGRTCGRPDDPARGPLYALLAELLDIVEPDACRLVNDPFNTELVWRPRYAAYYNPARIRSMSDHGGSRRRRSLCRCLTWAADDTACVLVEFAVSVPENLYAACVDAVHRRYPRMPDTATLPPARLNRYRPLTIATQENP